MRTSTREKISFTLLSVIIIFLFHFSIDLKLHGVGAFYRVPFLGRDFVNSNRGMLAAFAHGYGMLFYDSLLTIIVLFFYQRYYITLIRSNYNRVAHFITLVIMLICVALFIIYWLQHLLDVSIITGFYAS